MPSKEERIQNLKKANEQSHQLIVNSLREAMYELLETKDISEIKVVDLIRKAGVSRGGFYKNFYLVTDILKDDIKAVSDDVGKAIGGNIGSNWEMILKTVYAHKKKIPLLLKAGMGMQILEQMNAGIQSADEQFRMRIMVWNGIIFNCILFWNEDGYTTPIKELALKMTDITQALYNEEIASAYERKQKSGSFALQSTNNRTMDML